MLMLWLLDGARITSLAGTLGSCVRGSRVVYLESHSCLYLNSFWTWQFAAGEEVNSDGDLQMMECRPRGTAMLFTKIHRVPQIYLCPAPGYGWMNTNTLTAYSLYPSWYILYTFFALNFIISHVIQFGGDKFSLPLKYQPVIILH